MQMKTEIASPDPSPDTYMLAADVGGTKTRLGLFSLRESIRNPLIEETFQSKDYPSLEILVLDFLARNHATVGYASFGLAGPVIDGRAKITNLPWTIEERKLLDALQVREVNVINDLQAIATSVPFLTRSDLRPVNKGTRNPEGPVAVIAPGTGLGEAFITSESGRYFVHPSEGGHADFAPTDETQLELLRYMLRRFGHVSYEKVCSGIGIKSIHSFFKEIRPVEGPPSHAQELEAASDDPVPVIISAALSKVSPCQVCFDTIDTFVSILGAEVGNLALKVLATGGVYIGGGIPRKVLPLLKTDSFAKAFRNKGRLSGLVSQIPANVVLNPRAALLGAARSGFDRFVPDDGKLAQEVRLRRA